jgi:hypothetical protein
MNSIEEVAAYAKNVCLKDGFHSQMLIVDGTEKGAIMQLANGLPDDYNQKQAIMIKMGADLYRAKHIGNLMKVYFISEADMVKADANKATDLKIRPRFHPNRIDCLIITSLTPLGDSEMITYEVKRDANNKIIDLREGVKTKQDEASSGFSPLLQSFIVGFLKADKYTDKVLGIKS